MSNSVLGIIMIVVMLGVTIAQTYAMKKGVVKPTEEKAVLDEVSSVVDVAAKVIPAFLPAELKADLPLFQSIISGFTTVMNMLKDETVTTVNNADETISAWKQVVEQNAIKVDANVEEGIESLIKLVCARVK